MSALSGARAWIELTRLSNAPTVVSNVFCGVAVASAAGRLPFPWLTFLNVSLGCVVLYAAGMILNDAIDAEIDTKERPGRPIPSGRVPRHRAFAGGVAALAAGVALFVSCGAGAMLAALALACCIFLYNISHARSAWSVLLLGACRALIYPTAFAAVAHTQPWADSSLLLIAAPVGVYTAAFSLLARSEAAARPPWTRGVAWLLAIAGCAVVLVPPHVPGVLVGLWLGSAAQRWNAQPPRPVHAVMAWIAGLCLIDGAAVALFDWRLALVPGACFVATIVLQRRIRGS